MLPGDRVRIVKLRADGSEAASYDAVELEGPFPGDWRGFRAEWTIGRIATGGLVFEVGDYLHEYFSPTEWWNAFALFGPDGSFKGWYANVTWPTTFEGRPEQESVVWKDLYIDVIGLPDGRVHVLDEDELDESGLVETEPDLFSLILTTRDSIVRRLGNRHFPFHDSNETSTRFSGNHQK